MSISLVVLRFEVADDLSLPEGLDYCAPGFVTSQGMSASSEGHCIGGEEKDPAPSNVFERTVYRGGRCPHDIQVETLTRNSDAAHGEEQEQKGNRAFFCGNPEIIKGIIHIYENNEMTSLSEGIKRSKMVCMVAVPTKMTHIELMQFIAPSIEFIECVKIIRDATPNQYMVLVKFRSQEMADEFYNTFNGQLYNLLEEEACHLVYVARVETKKLSEVGISAHSQEELTDLENEIEGELVREFGPDQQVNWRSKDFLCKKKVLKLEKQKRKSGATPPEKNPGSQVSFAEERLKNALEVRKQVEEKLSKAEKEKKKVEEDYAQMVATAETLAIDLEEVHESNKRVQENTDLMKENWKKMEERRLRERALRQVVSNLQEQVADAKRKLEKQS